MNCTLCGKGMECLLCGLEWTVVCGYVDCCSWVVVGFW